MDQKKRSIRGEGYCIRTIRCVALLVERAGKRRSAIREERNPIRVYINRISNYLVRSYDGDTGDTGDTGEGVHFLVFLS